LSRLAERAEPGTLGSIQLLFLGLKTRSLITVAMLTALGKQHALKDHVRGALNNGATPAEISEVLLYASIYCGVPAAVEAYRSAAEVVDGPKKA
jgi:4-carboxymuconolactone decarboxylase